MLFSPSSMPRRHQRPLSTLPGFTIIELLIVIIIIGILVTITAMSYNGITKNARAVSAQSDLKSAAQKIDMFLASNPGSYPGSITDCPNPSATNICVNPSNGAQIVSYAEGAFGYGVTIQSNDGNLYSVQDGTTPMPTDHVSGGLVVNLKATAGGTVWSDDSGAGNNATVVSAPYSSANHSYSFDGVSQYAYLPRPVANDFSLGFWFKTTQTSTSVQQWYGGVGLLDCEVGGVTYDFGTSLSNGHILFGIGNPDTTAASPLQYNNGKWHYVIRRVA